MLPREIPAAMKAFRDVARLIKGLRALPDVWARLRLWPKLFWLAIYYDNAVLRGGILQERRLAAYLAASLLPYALITAAVMLGGRDYTVEAVLALAQKYQTERLHVPIPTGSASALAEPMLSPTRSTRVPLQVLKGKFYRPDTIKLKHASKCITCGGNLAVGTEAHWRRGVGTCHRTCAWPLQDPRP